MSSLFCTEESKSHANAGGADDKRPNKQEEHNLNEKSLLDEIAICGVVLTEEVSRADLS